MINAQMRVQRRSTRRCKVDFTFVPPGAAAGERPSRHRIAPPDATRKKRTTPIPSAKVTETIMLIFYVVRKPDRNVAMTQTPRRGSGRPHAARV